MVEEGKGRKAAAVVEAISLVWSPDGITYGNCSHYNTGVGRHFLLGEIMGKLDFLNLENLFFFNFQFSNVIFK